MATIYARGQRWYLNWSQHGRQHRKSLGKITEREADIQRKAKEIELSTGKRIFIASKLFEDHLIEYLRWHRVQFPDSHFRIAQIADHHFGDFRGRALSQIDSHMVERWKASRMCVVSRESAAKELRTLKAVFRKAVQWGEIEQNPTIHVESPKGLESEPIVWYSKADLAKLYKTRHGLTWRLMANTGLRRTEAQQLRKSQVDLKRKTLDVVSTFEARTKSGKWRQIPLSDGAIEAVKALIAQSSTDYVLPRIASVSLSRAFLIDVARLGLRGSLHSLRHTYAAHLVMAGVPLRTVQVLMGHASFKTTERYAHLGKDHLRDKARLVSL